LVGGRSRLVLALLLAVQAVALAAAIGSSATVRPAQGYGYDPPATSTTASTDVAFATATSEPALSGSFGAAAAVLRSFSATEEESGVIFRTGSQTDNALTDPSGVSIRDSVSRSTDGQQVFRPGDKIYGVDTSQLPPGSVVRDGVPDGHVSVFATPQQIRDAIVPYPLDEYGLNPLADGSYRLPK